jgi:hypothetical protein
MPPLLVLLGTSQPANTPSQHDAMAAKGPGQAEPPPSLPTTGNALCLPPHGALPKKICARNMKANASYNTKQLRKLNEEVSTLRSQVQELQQDHTTLQVQQHILARLVSWAHGHAPANTVNQLTTCLSHQCGATPINPGADPLSDFITLSWHSVRDALNWLRGGHAQAAVHQHWLAPGATAGGPSQQELALLHQLGMVTDSPLVLQLQQLHLPQHSNSSSEVSKSSHGTHSDRRPADPTHAADPQPMQQSPALSAQFASSILSPRAAVAADSSAAPAQASPAADPPDPCADAPAM